MKKYLKFIIPFIIGCLCFMIIDNVYAYAVIETNYGTFNPSGIGELNLGKDWGSWGTTYDKTSPWLYSLSYYWGAGAVKGTHITVNASYSLGIKCDPFHDCSLDNYVSRAQNTLTASNLRCGIGDYKQGYSSKFAPNVSRFDVNYLDNVDMTTGSQYLIHVAFTYNQDIPEVVNNNTNMSCWFERNPSNGLFAQTISGLSNTAAHYYYQTEKFEYAVSSDPNTAILTEITAQNDYIINNGNATNNKLDAIQDQNDYIINNGNATNNKLDGIQDQNDAIINNGNATNNKLDEVNGNITDSDTSGAQDTAGGFFNNFDTEDNGGLSSLISSPLTFVRKSTEKCTTLNLTAFEKDIPVPCGDELFWDKPEVQSFRIIWNCIVGGAALFMILSKVFKVIENLKDPEHDKVEVMQL